MSRHVTSRHVTSCHVMPRDVPHVTSCHVMSYHVMSRHVTSCMSRDVPHVTSCYTSCHTNAHVISRQCQMSCHVKCHVMSLIKLHYFICMPVIRCVVMSCHIMLRHIMSKVAGRSRDVGQCTQYNASLSTDFFHTQSIQIKHDHVRWLSRRNIKKLSKSFSYLPIQYRISGI